MDTIQENVEDLVTHITDYVDAQKELLLLEARERASVALAQTVIWVVVGLMALSGFLFLSVATALWLGHVLDSSTWGFLIVGGVYALTAIVFYINRKAVFEERLSGIFLTKLMGNDAPEQQL